MTDLSTLPFALDYGMNQTTPILSTQSYDDFVKATTTVDLNYNAQNLTTVYTPAKTVWQDIADTTSGAVDATTGFVWDTATGTWTSVKAGAAYVSGAVVDGAKGVYGAIGDVADWGISRILLIFGAIILGLFILGKSGVLKDAAAFIK